MTGSTAADKSKAAGGRAPRARAALGRLALVAWVAGAPAAAAVVAIAGGAGVADASTVAASSSGTSSTTAPPPPPAASIAFLPCNAPRAGSPCAAEPSQLQVNLPGGTDVTAVELAWVAEAGRSTGVPNDNPPTILQLGNQVTCSNPAPAGSGQTPTCWNWPASMEVAGTNGPTVINGTYQVRPCSSVTSSGCNPSADLGPSQAQVAAPPAPPTGLTATSQPGTITLKWQAGPEPDLVGYVITRNSQDIYTCSTNGFGPGAGRSCANPPSFSDNPGAGTWSYQVEALRFGVDTAPAHVVHSYYATAVASSSAPAGAPGAPSGSGSGAGGGGSQTFHFVLPPLPPTGVMSPVNAATGLAGRGPTTAALGEGGVPGVSGSSPNLPYGDNPALNGQSAEATGTSERPPVKAVHSVNAAAELALAVIALSLAVHAWYVRDELRKAAARVAARQAIDPRGLPST